MPEPLSLAAELEPLDLETLRGLLARQATLRPHHDDPAFPAWMERRDALRFQIEVKEGQARIAWKPAPGPNHPLPIPSPDQAPPPAEMPARPPRLSEIPMPKPTPVDPATRIEDLLGRIRQAAQRGEKCYWAQQTIRELCQRHHLAVPPEAQKVYGAKRPQPRRAPLQQNAPPQQLGKGSLEAPVPTEPAILQPSPINAFEETIRKALGHTLLANIHPMEWLNLVKPLADLEATARVLRQVAERQAEVA